MLICINLDIKAKKKCSWDGFICKTLYYVHVALTRGRLYFFLSIEYVLGLHTFRYIRSLN